MVMALAQLAKAETLLGKNYAGGGVNIIKFGDDFMDEVFGNAYGIGGGGNINLIPNLDLLLSLNYAWADGNILGSTIDISIFTGSGNLVYSFKPNEQINPFIRGGIGFASTAIDIDGWEETETDAVFNIGGGVEIEASEKVLLRTGLDYVYVDVDADDTDDIALFGTAGYWFSEQVIGIIGISYAVDGEDIGVQIGITAKM